MDDGHLIKATDLLQQEEADIEDLIGWPLYAHVVNDALGLSGQHELPTERPEDTDIRIVKEVDKRAKLFPPAIADFDHFLPAKHLGNFTNEQISDLPGLDEALDNFEKLFSRLNGLIGQQ